MRGLLVVPIGVSGSGKSFLREKLIDSFPDIKIVCPDDIRRDVTGDVSDQSKNPLVFNIVKKTISKYMGKGLLVFLDATNLYKPMKTKREYEEFGEVMMVIMTDSNDIDLCYSRISNDLSSGVDRSKVTLEVLQKQHEKFQNVKNEPGTYKYDGNYSKFELHLSDTWERICSSNELN